MVFLPVGGDKAVKPSKHNALVFCVVDGAVEATVTDTTFRLGRGGHFVVPRGNFYGLRNVGRRPARLFFAQGTDTLDNSQLASPA
ncbi:Mif2/CENP-C cupin domain-containing protein [Dipodascopsis tothii]|uniref:Mif2/CENP-C cupin domain-containing protein n=1 Tax=Dipodascopsis tothii TaxID=44089 RepID=UPI0034CD6055